MAGRGARLGFDRFRGGSHEPFWRHKGLLERERLVQAVP